MRKPGKGMATFMMLNTLWMYVGCGGNKKPAVTPPAEQPKAAETVQEPPEKQEEKLEEKTKLRPIYQDKVTYLKEYFNAREAYENFITAYEEGDQDAAEKHKQELLDNLKFIMEVLDVKNTEILYKNKEIISNLISEGLNNTPEKNFNLNLTDEDIEYINNMDPEEQKRITGVLKNIIETKKKDTLETKVLHDFPSDPEDPSVQMYIKLFVGEGKLADWYAEALQRGQKYFRFIEQEAEKLGFPKKIKYMYLIESAFTEVIRSTASAQGIAQFMIWTARKYGLVVNSYIDERRNPRKAIPASLRYLLDLVYHFEGDLEMAISAYNIGENGLDRRMERSGTLTIDEANKSRALPRETRAFLKQIDAAYIIGENYEEFGISIQPSQEDYPSRNLDAIIIREPTSLKVIARCAGIKTSELRKLNPDLISWRTPREYPDLEIFLPEGTADAYYENIVNVKDKTPASSRSVQGITIVNDMYIVRSGDTGRGIARKLKVTWYHLRNLNPSINWNRLQIKQKLNIPEDSPYVKDD